MLASISPVGEASRRQRWWVTVAAFTLASGAAGALLGAVLGTAGSLVGVGGDHPGAPALVAMAALLAAAADGGWFPVRSTGWRRQVDEGWLGEYRGWVYGLGYGFQLGAALLTIVPSAVTYVALLAAALTGRPGTGAVVGATFGLMRALPVLATAPVRTPAALRRVHRGLDAAARPVAGATIVAQLGVAAVAALAAADLWTT